MDVRTTSNTENPAGSPKLRSVKTAEFDRFEDLTRKLVKVPKAELDEKRADEA